MGYLRLSQKENQDEKEEGGEGKIIRGREEKEEEMRRWERRRWRR